jgi:glycosyltransferase involved in cell wall biosynthesis
MKPKFSIALCTFNSIKYIDECVMSLLNQTLRDFELIIIDDGSTDGTIEYLKGIVDNRVKVQILGQNHGLIYARTRAFCAATADYIALMDADDVAHPKRLEEQFKVLDSGLIDICATRYQTLETATNRLRARTSYIHNADLRALLTIYCPLCNPTVSFKRSLLKLTGYQQEFRHAEDYAFWSALSAKNCVFQILPQHLLTYRIHPQQISRMQSTQARESFLKARDLYVQVLLGTDTKPQAMPFTQRIRAGWHFMRALNRRLPGISVAANYEIYGEFQYRRNGWRTPLLRLERLGVACFSILTTRYLAP